jgi:hypothetical protein
VHTVVEKSAFAVLAYPTQSTNCVVADVSAPFWWVERGSP